MFVHFHKIKKYSTNRNIKNKAILLTALHKFIKHIPESIWIYISAMKKCMRYFNSVATKVNFILKIVTHLSMISHEITVVILVLNFEWQAFSSVLIRDSRWMSYEDSKKWVFPSKYPPQILMVCMHIDRKLILQNKIF